MLRVLPYRLVFAYYTIRLNQINCFIRSIAYFAIVTILVWGAAFWAFALDIPVRQGPFAMFAISHFNNLIINKAFFLEPVKKQVWKMPVFVRICCIVAVKLYMEIIEILFVLFQELCNQLFGLYAQFRSLYLYGSPMSIISTAINDILAYKP